MRHLTALAALLALAACGGGDEWNEAAAASPETLATTAAQRILAASPATLGGGVEVTGAKAEGPMLVLALSGMTDWRGSYSDDVMATTMKRGICFLPDVDALTKAGGRVRLESRTPTGVNLPPLTIAAC